ncbi:MAG: hypothetical protein KDA85_07250 [Planctomycetaceae bacterium]|nr:hypothetical protein [Planctomycetaceae bacterium]
MSLRTGQKVHVGFRSTKATSRRRFAEQIATGNRTILTSFCQRLIRHLVVTGCLLLIGLFSLPSLSAQQREEIRERRRHAFLEQREKIRTDLHDDLQTLRSWCTEEGIADRISYLDAVETVLLGDITDIPAPRFVQPPLPKTTPTSGDELESRIRKARETRAAELYKLARTTLNADFPTLAFSLIEEVLRMDPDHRYARAIQGQELFLDSQRRNDPDYAGEWVNAFEAEMRSPPEHRVDHPQFGWIPIAHVTRYEQGERPWKSDWVSATREAELRRDFRNAWEVETEHFLIRTNVSREAGVRMSRQLETFYSWLQQHLPGFFETPEAMKERFLNASTRRSRRTRMQPMEVNFFATRDEYRSHLRGKLPPDFEVNGIFLPEDRASYLYFNPVEDSMSTMFHEATHQIFDHHTLSDRRTAARALQRRLRLQRIPEWKICEHANFWLIEGLACYFESFRITDNGIEVGDPTYVRFETARQRLFNPMYFYYVPMQTFFGLGQDEFKNDPHREKLYTQASGTAHFLMHYNDGMYRDELVTLLSAVYRPDPKNILAEPRFDQIAGVSFEDLDEQYRKHTQAVEDALSAIPSQ